MESGDNFLKKAIKKSFPEGKICLQYSINEIYHIYGELTEEGNVDPECSECSSESNEEN